jgi:anti-sigma regulatory factor (Ser/Thr protein kinase)
METVLIDRWLEGLETISVVDEASVSLVRERVRDVTRSAGLGETDAASLVNVASELAHNQLAHARGGRIVVREVARRENPGVEVIAADAGDGIHEVGRALRGRQPDGQSLGIGLAAVCELADEVDFDVRLGEGTCVWARKFATRAAPMRCVGVISRAIEGERRSGDDVSFARSYDELIIALADGLGHGVEARDAASRAVDAAMHGAFEDAPSRLNTATVGTRGAVACVARIDSASAIEMSIIGNVSAHVCGRRATRRHIGTSSVLGSRTGIRAAHVTESLTIGEVLAIFSDGLSTKLTLEGEDALLHVHPIVIAEMLLTRFGTTRDDATIVVVK